VLSATLGARSSDSAQVIVGAVIMSAAMFGAVMAREPVALGAMVFFAGLGGGPIVPLSFSMVARRVTENRGAALSACQISCCAGGMMGPFFAGAAGDVIGLSVALLVLYALLPPAVLPLTRTARLRQRITNVQKVRQQRAFARATAQAQLAEAA